ncbi:Type IV fimbrial biogenesis protein PilW [Nitrincola lacisaponensis]|uniref:Type IV fimbrial biogenesis protein PilW n=1 Tax=Nitrincola lacisaponensis TaxID=267850 RepID=A0A063Y3G6_9GAMM|nr:PilW family protein [Nitrincola lacisaponensis]KDE39705.1 Type IV fimbrial biogenesis protein PilW [Nitrincola lacisaponensis]
MKLNHYPKQTKTHQAGLSLIELMISMVLGLLILAGVIQVFASTQQAYRTQEAMSRIQESGRYATEVLSRNIRQAGYKGGCGTNVDINILLDETDANYDQAIHTLGAGLEGWNNASPAAYAGNMNGYVANTDVLLVKHAATRSGITANGNTLANSATITIDQTDNGIPRGQIIIVAEDDACDIFQKANNENGNNLNRGNPGQGIGPGNKTPNNSNLFSKTYSENMRIMLFQSDLYYIGASDADPNNTALRRIRFSGTGAGEDQELVDNIINMQIRYGVDTNNNKRVDNYVSADAVANWEDVVAVRVSLLARSEHANILPNNMTGIPFDGGTFDAPAGDRRMYQAFTTTIGLRNKLP